MSRAPARTRFSRRTLAAGFSLALAFPGAALAEEPFRYDAATIDTAAHWAGRATLAHALMFGGIGEPVRISMTEMDRILGHVGYVVRPPMPDMAMVGAVYAAGHPRFARTPDQDDPRTLRWDAATFDRALDPEAQAWSIVKITAPEFHLNYHESRDERRIALMMLPQARAQVDTLANRLRDAGGLFAARSPEGTFAPPRPRQQVAVLWAAASVVLAVTAERTDYWHEAARALVDPLPARALGEAALGALAALPPESPADRALALAALGRWSIATDGAETRARALDLARSHARALRDAPPGRTLTDLGLTVYGLVEAGRLLGDEAYRDEAAARFRSQLAPLWDDATGAFREPGGEAVYVPHTLGALVAALNALRWHGPKVAAREADRLYPRLFETVLVRAGMMQASPLPLVPQPYLDRTPAARFAHPALPLPGEAGRAPVFAAKVRHANGAWTVADETFRTAEAMFLANMLVKPRDGRADAFLPADRLAALHR